MESSLAPTGQQPCHGEAPRHPSCGPGGGQPTPAHPQPAGRYPVPRAGGGRQPVAQPPCRQLLPTASALQFHRTGRWRNGTQSKYCAWSRYISKQAKFKRTKYTHIVETVGCGIQKCTRKQTCHASTPCVQRPPLILVRTLCPKTPPPGRRTEITGRWTWEA